jgi:predicted secreted protein
MRAAAQYRVVTAVIALREHISEVHFLRDKMEDSSLKFFRNKLRTLTGAERRLFERRAD